MNKTLRHTLVLLVSLAGSILLVSWAWRLAVDEWTVREGGWTYDPWYEKQCLRAIVTLWFCDSLRQIMLLRVMRSRLIVETTLLVAAYINFRLSHAPGPSLFPQAAAYGMLAVIVGCVVASVVTSTRDVLRLRQVIQKDAEPGAPANAGKPAWLS